MSHQCRVSSPTTKPAYAVQFSYVYRLHLFSGNMQMLDLLASDLQRRQYLEPMLSGITARLLA